MLAKLKEICLRINKGEVKARVSTPLGTLEVVSVNVRTWEVHVKSPRRDGCAYLNFPCSPETLLIIEN